MKTFKLLKCWLNADPANSSTVADTDTVPYFDSIKNLIYGIDYINNTNEDTQYDEDSFFDLVFTGPDGHPKLDYNSKSTNQGKKSEFDSPIDSNPKSHSPVKFRVFLLGFRKPNPEEKTGTDDSKHCPKDNSLRSKLETEREKEYSVDNSSSKQFSRATELPKFFKLVKPLYPRNSRMCTDKITLSNQVSAPLPSPSISSSRKQLEEKPGNRVVAFGGAVCKHVMKSRSTVSSFAGVPMNRRDDSLLEQNDGIQGAILHCKRSFTSTASKDSSMLVPRSTSEDVPRTSCYEEESRWSI